MSGKNNNRILLIVLLVLAAIFVVTRFTRVKNSNQTLRTDITEIDTSMVSSILLYPKLDQGKEIRFERRGSAWSVARDGIRAAADAQSVRNTLSELQNLETEQLVSRSPDSWSEFQVDDSLGTRIILKEGKKTSLDLIVGRFQYQAPPQGQNNMYGQNRVSGKTYIRLHGEEEVYSVQGFLAMSVNQPFERWRNNSICSISKSQLSRMVFDYPADSGYVAEKTGAGWMVAGVLADSASVHTYLNGVIRLSHSEFADGFQAGNDPDYRLTFEGDNMQTVQLSAYSEQGGIVLHSSINPDSWFSIEEEMFTDIFPAYPSLLAAEN